MLNFNENIYRDITYLGCASEYFQDIWESIDQINLLHAFGLDDVRAICRYLQCYAAPRGYILFEPETQADHLILVLSGGVRLTESKVYGEEEMDCLLGSVFGESSLVGQQPRCASGVTIMPTDFAILTRESLGEMLINHPRLANKLLLALMQSVTLRLRELDQSISLMPLRFS